MNHTSGSADQFSQILTQVATPDEQGSTPAAQNLVRTLFGRSRQRRVLRNQLWPEHGPDNPATIAATAGWHTCSARVNWDIDALVRDNASFLTFSDAQPAPARSKPPKSKQWRTLAFAPAENLLIVIRCGGLDSLVTVWAQSPEEAEQEFARLRQRYARKRRRNVRTSNFAIITSSMSGLDTRTIDLCPQIRTAADLELHYPEGFVAWSNEYIRQLKSRACGLSIFRGEPGVGKTSYIRHLTWRLRKTHRFYFLPITVVPLLSSPAGIEFWLDQHREHGNMRKVVVLEDAESLLMPRGPDNQESVSSLLNVADGLLGDALKLHVICTINCAVDKLDAALTRGGRLLTAKGFCRLGAEAARRIARQKGLSLSSQEDYSLAEIHSPAPEFEPAATSATGFTPR